jgi:hypothetical protein
MYQTAKATIKCSIYYENEMKNKSKILSAK